MQDPDMNRYLGPPRGPPVYVMCKSQVGSRKDWNVEFFPFSRISFVRSGADHARVRVPGR